MNLVKSLMGRRQFLITAGAASTSALAYKKLSGIVDPAFQKGTAMASERSGIADTKASENRYRHLLSPIQIGNVVLKNRIYSSNATSVHFMGPEEYPNETLISYWGNVAKNGASIVQCRLSQEVTGKYDVNNIGVKSYMEQLTDTIHFHDSKACVVLTQGSEPEGYNISESANAGDLYFKLANSKEIPVEMIQKMIEDMANEARSYKSLGFDMVNLYMSYNSSILANSLSPAMNKRKDKYGGSLENRARLVIELCQAIKKACGQDFLIEAQISGEGGDQGGYTIKDLIEYAKLWEGLIDIIQLRGVDGTASHPTGFNSQKEHPVTLNYAQALKESGVKITIAPVGGFQDLDLNEEFIASGKADMIAMARAFICDPEYGKKAYEGRGEDVVPCIRCNRCHTNACSVNPTFTFDYRVKPMIDSPSVTKKVAVIGGGPAGMKAAIVAAERGHKVTLYEKNDFLGGLLRHADFASFQWPVKEFKDHLIRQLKKTGVEVLLSTRATPEMINAKGYDAIVVAMGGEPVIPDIPGADGSNVLAPIFVFGNKKVGKNVAVIGGDLIGAETGMYLAENGHNVTVLTNDRRIAPDAPGHSSEAFQNYYKGLKTLSGFTGVTPTRISEGKVTYMDAKGNEKSIEADTVVISAGRKPRNDESIKFYGSCSQFFIVGDTYKDGYIFKSIRSAFSAASHI